MDHYSPEPQRSDECMMSGALDDDYQQNQIIPSIHYRSLYDGLSQRSRPARSVDDSDDPDNNNAPRQMYSLRSEIPSAANNPSQTAASSTVESIPRSAFSASESPAIPRGLPARPPSPPVKLRSYRLAAIYPRSPNRPQLTRSPRACSASSQGSPSRPPSTPSSEDPRSPSSPPSDPENQGRGGPPPPRGPGRRRDWPGDPPFPFFNFHLNMPPSVPRNPYLIRDRPVNVVLQPGARGYLCNRADIMEHLPNTRTTPFGRTFCPIIAYQNMGPSAFEALAALFSGLERYRATGCQLYLFENARHWLFYENSRAFPQCYEFFIGACNALDSEYGLGCSDALLQQIDEFAIDLMYSHDFGQFNRPRLVTFFMAYSKVFQPSTQRHMDTLRELYNSVPVQIRSALVAQLAGYLDARSQRSNPNVMFRAMRDMSMA
ncbi:hypothetical protein F5Y18DRAFT_425529 [Xylariaceae sp. FL1019]|nr:hypothetical protein F5Y18DRAFT_425529 [Xylariaceae sp. FL1019]